MVKQAAKNQAVKKGWVVQGDIAKKGFGLVVAVSIQNDGSAKFEGIEFGGWVWNLKVRIQLNEDHL